MNNYKEIRGCPFNHSRSYRDECCDSCHFYNKFYKHCEIDPMDIDLDSESFVMVNKDGRYWCDGKNTKNYKRAIIDTYYNFYETLWSIYNEGGQYDYRKWDAIGIIPYTIMEEAERLRKKSEEEYSRYLNHYIGIYFVNIDHYDMELVQSGDKNETRYKMVWVD